MSIANQIIHRKTNMRKASGLKIYQNNSVQKLDGLYLVQSASNPETVYTVENEQCDCPDNEQRRDMYKYCKHVFAVRYFEGVEV